MDNATPPHGLRLSAAARTGVAVTAVIDLVVGLAFLFGPELGVTLWPTPIPSILMRFIGAMCLAIALAWLSSQAEAPGRARERSSPSGSSTERLSCRACSITSSSANAPPVLS